MLLISSAAAQNSKPGDTTAILIGFSYNYDTYVWADSVLFVRRLGSRTVWGLNGGLSATQISSSDGLTRKQRFISGRTFIDHELSSRWSAGVSFAQRRQRLEELADRHFVFSDLLTQVKYSWSPSTWVIQRTGLSLADRSTSGASTASSGFASQTAARWEAHGPGDRLWQAHGSLKFENLREIPAKEQRWGASTSGRVIFGDTLSVLFEDVNRQTQYYPAADDYETIADQRFRDGQFLARAAGDWGKHLRWELTTDYGWHKESYALTKGKTPAASPLPLGLRQTSRGYRGLLSGQVGELGGVAVAYRYLDADEDFGASAKDQNLETGELEISAYCRPAPADSLGARVLWKVVSFVVPPQGGFYTDRDLATRLAELAWQHRFSPEWETTIAFSYRGFRQVFISGQWSGNNNHNDVYMLEPRLRWSPAPGWRVQQTYRIQANYLSYDVEKGRPQPERSTLYRRGESETRLVLAPVHRAEVELRYTYRYEDFGPLIWREKWNQLVSWDRRSHLVGAVWRYHLKTAWELVPGFSFEEKRSYDHRERGTATVRVRSAAFVRRVIELAVHWRPEGGRDDLHLSGSRRMQRSPSGLRDISNWVEFAYRRFW